MRRLTFRLGMVACLALLLAGCGVPGTISTSGHLPAVATAAPTPAPLPPVRFPQDEAPHHDLTEWWYYTGHLHGTDARGQQHTYGFELTFFQTLRGQFSPYYAAHYAISDITKGQFHYDERAGFQPSAVIPPNGSTSGFNIDLDGWSARGLAGHDHLGATMSNYALDLQLTGQKPAVLHGGNGIITYGAAGFSYYYSRPLMLVTGTLTDHGAPVSVSGQAWMDHQWGNFVSLAGAGWDWYSIQLANNVEYMLYIIRDEHMEPISVFGTAISQGGAATEIQSADIHILATNTWTSPTTGGTYPSGWDISIPSQQLTLSLSPLLRDQELVTACSTGVAYWEGAVGVQGRQAGEQVTGESYVELTGYATIPPSRQCSTLP